MTAFVRTWLADIHVMSYGPLPEGADEWLTDLEEHADVQQALIFADWLEDNGHAGCEAVRLHAHDFDRTMRDYALDASLTAVARETRTARHVVQELYRSRDAIPDIEFIRSVCELARDCHQDARLVLKVLRFPRSIDPFLRQAAIGQRVEERFRSLSVILQQGRQTTDRQGDVPKRE